jgi:acyl-CoA synthetase (AMP-forming)/AMP-acid ligase II
VAVTLLENRPEYVLHKLALNSIGVCCVPINPDYRKNLRRWVNRPKFMVCLGKTASADGKSPADWRSDGSSAVGGRAAVLMAWS